MAQEPTPGPQEGASPLGAFHGPQFGQAQRRFWLTLDAAAAALVVVALIGAWAYFHVRGSLREVRTAGLFALLEAESRGLQIWIDEKQRDAERWASTPAVQRHAAELAARGADAVYCAPLPQKGLQNEIAPYSALEELAVFNLIARDGRIVSSPHPGYCGLEVSARFLRELAPVFAGRTVFMPPWPEGERVAGASARREGTFTWVETPVRDGKGDVVAALGFGRVATERFAKLLALTGAGASRDAYAFDERARMLTESSYSREFAASIAGASQGAATGLVVREPAEGGAAGSASGDRPLTALAAAALAREDGSEGVLLEPYRNYRGAQVIGAWRWLPDARMTVAVEVDASEAYAPLKYLQTAFTVLFALVLVSMAAAAGTSLWAVRMRLREARRVGQYVLGREIGTGGMSHVYLARHALLKRLAAVKVLKPHLATDEAVTRFRREAQLCSQLSHPNTVEIYDYGTTRDGRWYYAMEFLRGISIEDLVRRHGPMTAARVVHTLRQACGSLEEAHARGWVHRDVKPNNLMLCTRGGEHDILKVLDFGLIKQVRDPDSQDITQYSRILGTPLYMAPERLRNPADADARADIYALAAVAHFALAGRPAFEAETDHDIVYRVLNEAPATLEGVAGVPPALATLIASCLAKDRESRPAQIGEVRAALDAIAREIPWTDADARAWWAEWSDTIPVPVDID